MTAVEYLIKQITKEKGLTESYDIFYEALEMEREQRLETLIEFQVFLNEYDYINDSDWDWEHMGIKFLNSKKQEL